MRIQTLYHSNSRAAALIAVMTMALLPGTLRAQVPAAPLITIVSTGLGCSTSAVSNGFAVLSWKLGADAPPSTPFGPVGGGKFSATAFSDVTITKSFDECSPALFRLVAAGNHLQTITLTQSVGGVPKMTVVLGDSLVYSYYFSGGTGSPLPTETVAFRYQKITITNLSNGVKSCFDLQRMGAC
jgi:type VI protein secretion system component Hcp